MAIFKNKKRAAILISWVAILLWMLLIFIISSKVGEESNKLSKGVAEFVVRTVEKIAPDGEFDMNTSNYIIRKNSHFFAYLILGVLVLNTIRRCGLLGFRGIVLAFSICILYAISDEIHQLFVPGRGPHVKDVFIDSEGAIVGIGMYWVVSRMKHLSFAN